MEWFRFFSIRSKLIGLLLINIMTIAATAYIGDRQALRSF